MSTIMGSRMVRGMFRLLTVGATALAIGSTGCMGASTAHDVAHQNASQSTASVVDSNGSDGESRSDGRSSGANQVAVERAAPQAERSDGSGSGPYPLPWTPSPRSGGGTAQGFENPGANQRALRVSSPSPSSKSQR